MVLGILWRLAQKLGRHVSARHGSAKAVDHRASSSIENLPPELYVAILQELKPTHGIILSLTCKQLWRQVVSTPYDALHKARRCSKLSDRIEFLLLLEKDKPGYIICTMCMKLHKRINNESTVLVRDRDTWRRPRHCTSRGLNVGGYRNHVTIDREAVELILRAASLGPAYGLDSSTLTRKIQYKTCSTSDISLEVSFDTEAMVVGHPLDIGPSLFLRTRYRVDIDLERSLDKQVEATDVKVCEHMYGGRRLEAINVLQEVALENTGDTPP